MDHVHQDVYIAVMGVTGSGKSTFIQTASPTSLVGIGHGLRSSFEFEHQGRRITLIDTPGKDANPCNIGQQDCDHSLTVETQGFNDSVRTETEVLKAIADWLDWTYRNDKITLNGIVYLQSIMDPKMYGSSLRNLKMFKELCGEKPLKNVVLATTRWGVAARSEQGELAAKHEAELRDDNDFWAPMLRSGSRMARFGDTRDSALEILLSLVDQPPEVLQIQSELVDERKDLINTRAGNTVNEEIARMQSKYQEELAQIQRDLDDALASRDEEVQAALRESKEGFERKLERLRSEQDMLRYERRNEVRQLRSEMEGMRREKEGWEAKLGAQRLDFESTVEKLLANQDKLRHEQAETLQAKIDEMREKPKWQRTAKNLVLALLPTLGSVVLALLGIPVGLGGLFGGAGS